MRGNRAGSATFGAGFAAAALAALLAPAATQAQVPVGRPPAGRDPTAEARERQQREASLRSIELVGKAAPPPADRRGAELAAAQVREDFRRIQVVRNDIARHVLSGKPLDYKFIAGVAAEVNKRASRLKTLLVREAPEADEKDAKKPPEEIGEALMKNALVTLCKRIDSFTENPVFMVPDVVDVEQSARAGKDLQDILLLSGAVRKGAERAAKASKK